MKTFSRRGLLGMAAAGVVAVGPKASVAKTSLTDLSSITAKVLPITAQEHGTRIAKLQKLMQQRKIAAFLVEAGSSLEYFTGIHWWRSERTTAALIPAEGAAIVVTPFFEEPSVRETLKVLATAVLEGR